MQGVFQLFFKSRGRNLLLALTTTVLFLLLLRRLHLELYRRGPLRRYGSSFHLRLFDLMFAIFTGIGGVLVFLIVLYVFGDRVLLNLMVMLRMGLVWASKQAIPAFWTQATLLLNMGPVREGERVLYRGVPFRVASLGFYTQLENPVLSIGELRLPINDLTKLRSRPSADREPWFSTLEGDWILLPDGKLANVVRQSLDLAVLCDFRGEAAPDYENLTRLVNQLCVDACDANGWLIPFQQVTLHVAAQAPEGGAPAGDPEPAGT